jgi:hypothetical protein
VAIATALNNHVTATKCRRFGAILFDRKRNVPLGAASPFAF